MSITVFVRPSSVAKNNNKQTNKKQPITKKQKTKINNKKRLALHAKCSKIVFLIPAMLTVIIEFYHLIPLSLTLTLPGVARSARSATNWLYFVAHF